MRTNSGRIRRTLPLAIVVGLVLPVLVPTSASAAPCSTLAGDFTTESVPNGIPLGRKPTHADDNPDGKLPEFGQPISMTSATDPEPEAARPESAAEVEAYTIVKRITGETSQNQTRTRFHIAGADLGILWDNGESGANNQTLVLFGDTFYCDNRDPDDWRNNTLFRAGNRDLSIGLPVADAQFGNNYAGSPVISAAKPRVAKELIHKLGIASAEVTVIPTAAISIGTTQYVSFMSVRQWGEPGQWTTNYSGIATSTDNGENWTVHRQTLRVNKGISVSGGPAYVSGNERFQMGAYLRSGGYLYQYGTPSGRSGSGYVARVPEADILDLGKYEYWSSTSGWVPGTPSAATVVLPAPVSEMSVAYNATVGAYIAMYTNGNNDVILRTALEPQGPWSNPQTVATSWQISGGIYAPYIHPWSSGSDLYFTLSRWSDYSVLLLKTTLGTGTPTPPPSQPTPTPPPAPLKRAGISGKPKTGQVNVPVDYQFRLTGNPMPTVVVTEGALPDGLTLSSTGHLTGTPTTANRFKFTLTVSNGVGNPRVKKINWRIKP